MTTVSDRKDSSPASEEYLPDVTLLRERAREIIESGPLKKARSERRRVVDVLNETLAIELVSVLRYKRHFYVADVLNALSAADEFLEHAASASDHADKIAERIGQLGGKPNFNPVVLLGRNPSESDFSRGLETMIQEDLIAVRVIIATYVDLVTWIGESDSTTRRLLEEILTEQEEHAEDLLELVTGVHY